MDDDTLLSHFEKSAWKAKIVGYSELIIETLDNPGWTVRMPIVLEGYNPVESSIDVERANDDWVQVTRRPRAWDAAGGPRNLGEVLSAFISWVEHGEPPVLEEEWLLASDVSPDREDPTVLTLQDWYVFNCSGFWEHCYGLTFSIEAHEQWKAQIDLYDTIAEEVPFEPVDATLPGGEQYRCWVEDCVFHGKGTKFTLEAMCRVFCDWVAPLLAEASNE